MRLGRLTSILLLLSAGLLPGWQDLSSIEKQKMSVRKQLGSTGPSNGFFTTEWLTPAVLAPSSSGMAAPVEGAAGGDCEALSEASLGKLILDASQREGVDPKLVKAMVRRESGGKPCAISVKGAQGLMQIMPATQADLGIRDPFDPNDNVAGGVRYLKQMLDRYEGNTALALAAYNAGPQRVTPGGRIPDIPETQAYVLGIMSQLNEEDKAQ